MKHKRFGAALLALSTTAGCLSAMPAATPAAAYGTGNEIVERLNRGISAINTGNGMLVSWRFLANDADDAAFELYRDGELIYTSTGAMATCYLDKGGSAGSKYRVDTRAGGRLVSSEECTIISGQNYFDIPLNVPPAGEGGSYSANDCSCGDADGDGTYEIFVKWDPEMAQDNSFSHGHTGSVYIDCYRLDGTQLWRIDLGRNIRAGAHYTQFLVADFDCDGKAEMTCKTCDGTVDGTGKVIGNANADYRNDGGHIISGPEYYTLFDGETGAALDTVNYEYPRGEVTKQTWGDNYGNRSERFLGAVMYCDGVHPSAVSIRGYYTRMTAVAYDVVNKKLVKRWGYDTGYNASAAGYGNGNHNCMCADVDGDGKQELLLGATALDDNGKVLWTNWKGHGDAMHLGDFIPERPGQELFVCHEHEPYGISLIDAATGKDIFHFDGDKDTGRCCCDNIYAGNPGTEFWGARPAGQVLDQNGQNIGLQVPAMNFLIYWDGDLEREIQSDIQITKMNASKKLDVLLNADGCASNNSTKATPNLTADIIGDWREELLLRKADSKALRVFCTPYETDYRLTTLMHDTQYRTQVAGEQTSYNQPPHASFFLGTGYDLPERPNVTVLGGEQTPIFDYHTGDCTDYIPADLNYDGKVNAVDMTLLKQHLLHNFLTRPDCQRADVDTDGEVSMADLLHLQKYLLNKYQLPLQTNGSAFQYAIDAKWDKGIKEKTNAGFKQDAYLNLDNVEGSYVEFQVYVPEDSYYQVTFQIANGGADARDMAITVNGAEAGTLSCPSTGDWTTWKPAYADVTSLKKGMNTIRLTSLTANGGPNFDYVTISLLPPPMS